MDLGILVGLVALVAILAHAFSGTAALLDPTGLLVCIGGAVAATLVAYPIGDVLGLGRVKLRALFGRRQDAQALIRRIVSFADTARRRGILALEQALSRDDDPFLQGGTRLAVDGTEPDLIMDILETELRFIQDRHRRNHDIFRFYGLCLLLFGGAGSLIALGLGAGDLPAALPAAASPAVAGLVLAGLTWAMQRKLAT